MKNRYIVLLSAVVFSCNSVAQVKSEAAVQSSEVIVHKEYIGTEPTKPGQTEFYEPIVPKVDLHGRKRCSE